MLDFDLVAVVKTHEMFKDIDEYLKNKYGKDYEKYVGQISIDVINTYDDGNTSKVGCWEFFDDECLEFKESK